MEEELAAGSDGSSDRVLQCTPEQISKELQEELMCRLDHDDSLQKVSQPTSTR